MKHDFIGQNKTNYLFYTYQYDQAVNILKESVIALNYKVLENRSLYNYFFDVMFH